MGSRIQGDGAAFVCLAIAVVLIPLKWVLAWFVASVIHELCHILALRLCRCRVLRVNISVSGVVIRTEPLSPPLEAICAIAGPLGSFSLLLLSRYIPSIAICGCLQAIYNLLPLDSMDGGRILKIAISRFLPLKSADQVMHLISVLALLFLFIFSVYIFIFTRILVPLLFTGMLILKERKKTLQKVDQAGTIVLPD